MHKSKSRLVLPCSIEDKEIRKTGNKDSCGIREDGPGP